MHMADALISPAVGGVMLAAAAGAAAYSVTKVQNDLDEKKIPLMGVMGAFIFAAQMINFSIPGTGSSGHLGGGLLLSVVLGPYAGFLTMASVLLIQALFFADGGWLAYGCNVFNLGFYTCFIAYPLIYKKLTGKGCSTLRIVTASLLSSVVGLQFGAFSVVLQTFLSGRSELPLGVFALWMQPIHLAIGVVEGLITAAVVVFIWRARPEILESAGKGRAIGGISIKKVIVVLTAAALITGGIFSRFASSHPDGLEWSMSRASGKEELGAPAGIHELLSGIQNRIAFLPDYGFKASEGEADTGNAEADDDSEAWPAVSPGTSVSGLVGGSITLALAVITGFVISIFKKRRKGAYVKYN